jgi:hypothetical protein
MPRRRKPFRRAYRIGRSRTGLGCFATREIQKNELIDYYRGQLITTEEAEKRENRYMFEVNSRWTIDGSNRRNLARYFNHSCRPNAEADVKGHKVIITARRKIQPGEEITYDYGKDYFDTFLRPVGCKCDKCLEKKAAARKEARERRLREQRRAERRAATAAAAPKALKTPQAPKALKEPKAPLIELRAAAAGKKEQVKRGKVGATKKSKAGASKKKKTARKRK